MPLWRLVFQEGGLDYNTVFHQMTIEEVNEANAALDLIIKTQKEAMKKK